MKVLSASADCIDIIKVNQTNATCGMSDGSITFKLTISPPDCSCTATGTASYRYQLNNGTLLNFTPPNEVTIPNLSTGTYTLVVYFVVKPVGMDEVVCSTDEIMFDIEEQNNMNVQISNIMPSNCDNNTGAFTVMVVSGGAPPYTVNANNLNKTIGQPGGSTTFDNLSPAIYPVTVTDDNGCVATATATVTSAVTVSLSVVESKKVTCNGGSDGILQITQPTPGTPGYSYSINPTATFNNTTNEFTGLEAGTYIITATDIASSCTASLQAMVTEPAAINIQSNVQNVSCRGLSDGGITLTVSGGNGTTTYKWSNDKTTKDLSDLSPGVYTVTVTDLKNCTGTASATVNEPGELDYTIQPSQNPVESGEQLQIFLSGSDDIDYFEWELTEVVNLIPTTLDGAVSNNSNIIKTFTVENERSPGGATFQIIPFFNTTCTGDTQFVRITVLPALGTDDAPFIPEIYTPNGDGQNDVWQVAMPDGVEKGDYTIFNRLGGKVFEGDTNNPWDGSACPDGPYFYVLRYTQDGAEKVVKGAVTILRTTD